MLFYCSEHMQKRESNICELDTCSFLRFSLPTNTEPLRARSDWSDPLPCSIKTNSDNRKGRYEDGEFRQASFTILVECIPFPYNRVKLERMGENLGEYRVMNAEPLTTVGRTQIVV